MIMARTNCQTKPSVKAVTRVVSACRPGGRSGCQGRGDDPAQDGHGQGCRGPDRQYLTQAVLGDSGSMRRGLHRLEAEAAEDQARHDDTDHARDDGRQARQQSFIERPFLNGRGPAFDRLRCG